MAANQPANYRRRAVGMGTRILTQAGANLAKTAIMSGLYGGARVGKYAYNRARNYISNRRKKNAKAPSTVINNSGNARKQKPLSKPLRLTSKNSVKSLARQVKQLSIKQNTMMGELIYRNPLNTSLTTTAGLQNSVDQDVFNASYYEIVLQQLRYYNPSAPSTLVTADGATGTYDKSFRFESNVAKMTLRNNFRVPVEVAVYYCKVKSDTNTSPRTAWDNGISDKSTSGITSPYIYPTDSDIFTDLWNVTKTVKKQLEAGETMCCKYTEPSFNYDPAVNDNSPPYYTKYDKAFSFLVVVKGIVCHDNTAQSNINHAPGGVDILTYRMSKVKYNAGGKVQWIHINNGLTSITTGVVSQKPSPANQSYSASI